MIACGLVYLSRLHGVINLTTLIGVHDLFSVMQGLISVSNFTTSNLRERVVSSDNVVGCSFLFAEKNTKLTY